MLEVRGLFENKGIKFIIYSVLKDEVKGEYYPKKYSYNGKIALLKQNKSELEVPITTKQPFNHITYFPNYLFTTTKDKLYLFIGNQKKQLELKFHDVDLIDCKYIIKAV